MPALAPVPPATLKVILEACGFSVAHEDAYNWTMVRGETEPPINLPKLGPLVSLDAMMQILSDAKIDNLTYLTLKAKYGGKHVN
jgi:hypothetical protein